MNANILSASCTLTPVSRQTTQDRYEIMAFAAEARSKALGGTPDVGGGIGAINNADLQKIWKPDPSPNSQLGPYSAHKWHSAQFRSTHMAQRGYWSAILDDRGFNLGNSEGR
jgi:hypothetical protein